MFGASRCCSIKAWLQVLRGQTPPPPPPNPLSPSSPAVAPVQPAYLLGYPSPHLEFRPGHLLVELQAIPLCESECVCVQAVQQDPRVTQLVKDLNKSIQAAAEDSGDSIPAVLVLNKVSTTWPN